MSIQRIKSADINRNKWDNCIKESFNSSVYGYSWYLDAVCSEWEALVENDYEALLPLPIQKLGGIKYVANPAFAPMLSVYARSIPSPAKHSDFFSAIPYGNIKLCMIPYNGMPKLPMCKVVSTTMVIDLILPFQPLLTAFQSYFQTEKQAEAHPPLTILRTQNLNDYLAFRKIYRHGKPDESQALRRLISFCLRFKSIGIYAAYNKHNTPVAMLILLKNDNRLTVIDVATESNRDGELAYFGLLAHIMRNHAESNQVLSFPTKYLYLNTLAQKICTTGVQYKRGVVRFL